MILYTNIPDIIKRLQQLKVAVGGNGNQTPPDFSDALFAPLNSGMGKMKYRIFNEGKDAEGKSLGSYHGRQTRITDKKFSSKKVNVEDEDYDAAITATSKELKKKRKALNKNTEDFDPEGEYTEYEKIRLANGKSIEFKNLQFSDSLYNSIEPVRQNNKAVIAFTNSENRKIARYQEQQIANIRAGLNARAGKAAPARIFALSRQEFDFIKEQSRLAIINLIRQKIRTA